MSTGMHSCGTSVRPSSHRVPSVLSYGFHNCENVVLPRLVRYPNPLVTIAIRRVARRSQVKEHARDVVGEMEISKTVEEREEGNVEENGG